jgi:PleD family two-component response regulator
LNEELGSLIEYAQIGDEKSLLAKLAALVPGYMNGDAPTPMPQEKLGRILLLGKDAYTRMTLCRILQPRSVIFEAEDESEALQQVHARHPNMVILGLHLPEVNVRKLCATLKRANGDARLPVMGGPEAHDN